MDWSVRAPLCVVLLVAGVACERDRSGDGTTPAARVARDGALAAGAQGSEADDVVVGRSGDDALHGGGGNDTLRGGAGDDRLHGDQGDDALDGGAGDDALDGGEGDDDLLGGEGDDRLHGGPGADDFHVDLGLPRVGLDVIDDFDASQGDRIILHPSPELPREELLERLQLERGVLQLRLQDGGVLQLVRLGEIRTSIDVLSRSRALVITAPLQATK